MNREQHKALLAISSSASSRFHDLARLSGLDPQSDFRFADLSGADLRSEDLTQFDFTCARLTNARVHGARFNNSVTDEQLSESDRKNHAVILIMGHSESKLYERATRHLPRDFSFSKEISAMLDQHRQDRSRAITPGYKIRPASYAELIVRVRDISEDVQSVILLLTTSSASAMEVARTLVSALPERSICVISLGYNDDVRAPPYDCVQFRTGKIEGGFGSVENLVSMCDFLHLSSTAQRLLELPENEEHGLAASRTLQRPSIITLNVNVGETLGGALRATLAYDRRWIGSAIRLYISTKAYNRTAIIKSFRETKSSRIEICAFAAGEKHGLPNGYLVIADPSSNVWKAIPSPR